MIHVIDAKNIERMLPLTFQLMEARLRLVLVLNMFDEAQKVGNENQHRAIGARSEDTGCRDGFDDG